MKKLFTLTLLWTGLSVSAQTDYNKWSVSYAFGSHALAKPSSGDLLNFAITHHELAGRYMFGDRLGIMLDLGYDKFKYPVSGQKISEVKGTDYLRVSVQSVVNLGHIIGLQDLHERFGLLLHAGGGYSYMWKKVNDEKRKDNIVNLIVGLTPQLRITDHWAINADISLIGHLLQSRKFNGMGQYKAAKLTAPNANNYDFQDKNDVNRYISDKMNYEMGRKMNSLKSPLYKMGIGGFLNVSLGVTYYIGKKEKHADWIQAVYGGEPAQPVQPVDLSKIEKRISNLEDHVKDDDNDGVINKLDLEENTPAGTLVNSHGQELKEVAKVEEPKEVEEAPERTEPTLNDLKVLREVSESIYFNVGGSEIQAYSYSSLNKLTELLKNNNISINIAGYTDNSGNDEKNLKLSQDRTDAVKRYLVSRGISADRINAIGYGSANPVADNSTKEGKAQNRRVEITTGPIEQTIKLSK